MTGIVFDIEKFALHDGPGIRTVVFMKGCPLRCIWCHNPESQETQPEIFFTPEKCIGCGWCFQCCPNHCHVMEGGKHVFRRENCIHCGKCTENCYAGALEKVGEPMSVDEVIVEVMKDRIFYDRSGGGLTLSGGEPMFQFEFTKELLQAAKKEHLHTCVETCGYAPFARLEELFPLVDLWLWDVKASDPEKHRQITGISNELILENLFKLDDKGVKSVLRCPLVPSINDDEKHLLNIAKLANSLKNVQRIDLEPYHPLGENKNKRLGCNKFFTAQFVTVEEMNKYRSFLREKTTITVQKQE